MFRRLKTYQLVLDLSAAAIFFLLTGFVQFSTASGAPEWWSVLVAVFMAGALALRRLSPALALGIAWAGAILQMSLALNPLASNVAVLAVLYAAAAYGSRRTFWAGFTSALVGALVITVYLFLGTTFFSGGPEPTSFSTAALTYIAATFALLLAWTTGALVRTALRARANRQAQERAEAEAIAEQERVRIARDMHDVVAHSLAVVIAQADGARYAASADPAAATEALGTISTIARSALADVRVLLTQLRHSQSGGPQPTLGDLEELFAQVRAAGVDLRVELDPAPSGEPAPAVQLAIYRILQEALTNALRHGGGPVDVRLSWHAEHVDLVVRNPILAGAAVRGGGHGVIGMTERAQLAGGTLQAGRHGEVFLVRASIPIALRQAQEPAAG